MNLSFFEYVKRYANPEANDPFSRFANEVIKDTSFPKHKNDFNVISDYLEHNPNYSKMLTIFDEVWNKYQYEL